MEPKRSGGAWEVMSLRIPALNGYRQMMPNDQRCLSSVVQVKPTAKANHFSLEMARKVYENVDCRTFAEWSMTAQRLFETSRLYFATWHLDGTSCRNLPTLGHEIARHSYNWHRVRRHELGGGVNQ